MEKTHLQEEVLGIGQGGLQGAPQGGYCGLWAGARAAIGGLLGNRDRGAARTGFRLAQAMGPAIGSGRLLTLLWDQLLGRLRRRGPACGGRRWLRDAA